MKLIRKILFKLLLGKREQKVILNSLNFSKDKYIAENKAYDAANVIVTMEKLGQTVSEKESKVNLLVYEVKQEKAEQSSKDMSDSVKKMTPEEEIAALEQLNEEISCDLRTCEQCKSKEQCVVVEIRKREAESTLLILKNLKRAIDDGVNYEQEESSEKS